MPVLVLHDPRQPKGVLIQQRVLIGRRPFNTIMVADPSVSRIHAWVRCHDGVCTLYDAGSRAGTTLNGQRVTTPVNLADADQISIGPASLTFHQSDSLPEGVETLDPAPAPPASDPYDGGIYFDCSCGGPMWVTADLAGASGRCRYCGERLVVPHKSGATARQLAPAAGDTAARRRGDAAKAKIGAQPIVVPHAVICSICQTPIAPSEEKTSCPSCHLTFHAACWQENFGCSAYGCDQVNILAEGGAAPVEHNQTAAYETPLSPPREFPWDSVILALSFVAMGLGALAFGATSLVMLVWGLVYLLRAKTGKKSLLILAIIISIMGCLAGFVTSMFWWRGVRLWERFV